MLQSSQAPKLYFVTLGCAKNEVDTVHMIDRVLDAGYEVVDNPQEAQGVIVNTCSFIQAATEESLEMIFDLADLDVVKSGKAKLIVSGCMTSRYGESLSEELMEVDTFIACQQEDDIVEVLQGVWNDEFRASPISQNREAPLSEYEVAPLSHNSEAPLSRRREAPLSSYVKISEGCDRFCSYCTIPYIRGRYHSFPREHILAEVESLVARGSREIVLIAQDTGTWGSDFEEPEKLSELLDTLALRFENTWFRVMYIQPEGITDDLLDVVAGHSNICSYFDIPFQHSNTTMLKNMRRPGSRKDYAGLIEHIRTRIPEVTLRTTLIAGFPGEDEEAFEDLLSFVEEIDLDYVGVFPYSQEEGTKAADMPDQIPHEIKLTRAQELRDLADLLSTARVAQRVGQSMEVLILGTEEDGQLFGRAMSQAPDVDGIVYLNSGSPGDFRRVTITGTLSYEMEGELGDYSESNS